MIIIKTAKVEWNEKEDRFELAIEGKSLITSDSKKILKTLAEDMNYEVQGETE